MFVVILYAVQILVSVQNDTVQINKPYWKVFDCLRHFVKFKEITQ